MNNDIENETKDNSLNDYEIEVDMPEKKGFFANIIDKLKGNNSTKLLDSGEKETFQKTSRSISSMWAMGSLRSTISKTFDNISKALFKSSEKVEQNNITTEIIGQSAKKKDDLEQTAEKMATIDPVITPIIPKSKSPLQAQAMSNEKIIPKGIINNAKSAKDVREDNTSKQSLKVEKVAVSEDFVEEFETNQKDLEELTAGDVINKRTIEVGDINIGQAPTEDKDHTKGEERE